MGGFGGRCGVPALHRVPRSRGVSRRGGGRSGVGRSRLRRCGSSAGAAQRAALSEGRRVLTAPDATGRARRTPPAEPVPVPAHRPPHPQAVPGPRRRCPRAGRPALRSARRPPTGAGPPSTSSGWTRRHPPRHDAEPPPHRRGSEPACPHPLREEPVGRGQHCGGRRHSPDRHLLALQRRATDR